MVMGLVTPNVIGRQLNAWVWPGKVAEAALELRQAPVAAHETITLWLRSEILSNGQDGAYDHIIRECLRSFSLSSGLLDLVNDLYGSYMSKNADDMFRELTFSESVEFLDSPPVDEQGVRRIARLKLPAYKARILSKPLDMLTDLIGQKLMYWRNVAAKLEPTEVRHLDSPSLWALPAWIDAVVGRYVGFETLGQFGFMLDDRYHLGGYDETPAYFGPIPISNADRRTLEMAISPSPHGLALSATEEQGLLDGFRKLGSDELKDGVELNLRPHSNIFSPFSRVDRAVKTSEKSLVVDENYGLIYDDWFHRAPGLYGQTEVLPGGPLDHLATEGFLRTPFRRIPRIAVESPQKVRETVEIIRELSTDRTLLFRGQNREFLIPRDGRTLLSLFGDEDAREPSILASAVRKGVLMSDLLPEWCGLVNTTLRGSLEAILKVPDFAAHEGLLRAQYNGLCSKYIFGQFALALAQHYGLPSNGVDTTTCLEAALSFALHEYTPSTSSPGYLKVNRPTSWDDPPVLYMLAIPKQQYEIRFRNIAPIFAVGSRPEAQNACFIHSGWGRRGNDATRWLVAALYIMEPFRFDLVSDPVTLFPSPETDILGRFLQQTAKSVLRSERLRAYLDDFYWLG